MDNVPREEEEAKARVRVRRILYGLYGVESYSWGVDPDGVPVADGPVDYSDPTVAVPNKTTRKPYVPPTPMTDDPSQPFAGLDAPLG